MVSSLGFLSASYIPVLDLKTASERNAKRHRQSNNDNNNSNNNNETQPKQKSALSSIRIRNWAASKTEEVFF